MEGPLIDRSTLDRLFKGDVARVEQWMRLYLEEAPTYINKLAVGLALNDADALASAAHDLRPQAHYLGCARMLELLIAIGERARTDGPEACARPVNELLGLCAAIEAEIRGMID